MPDDKPRSRYYLPRNSPEEQAEAAKLLRWDWSPRAHDLLTRYPRRVLPYAPLTLEEVRIQNAALSKPFPEEMIMDFQRELGGVTYSTFEDDGEWATWGLTYIGGVDKNDLEPGEEPVLPCFGYNTARGDGFALAADGTLWEEVPAAVNAIVAVERLAFALESKTKINSQESVRVVIRQIPLSRESFVTACHAFFDALGWPVVPATADHYGCLWAGTTGWASYSSETYSDQTLLHSACFLNRDEAAMWFRHMKELLPHHEISVIGMPTPTAPG